MSLRIGDLTVLNVLIWKAFVQSYIEKTVSFLIFAHLCSRIPKTRFHTNMDWRLKNGQYSIGIVDYPSEKSVNILDETKLICDAYLSSLDAGGKGGPKGSIAPTSLYAARDDRLIMLMEVMDLPATS
ncbi:hypothetical protein TNCV_913151 [Trichonephila clavipes]|nr:hypothetical protein TNCV_913151 [Trichonephila clavipes]